jgi:hypothetical protein
MLEVGRNSLVGKDGACAELSDFNTGIREVRAKHVRPTADVDVEKGIGFGSWTGPASATDWQGFRTFLSYMNPQQLSAELI